VDAVAGAGFATLGWSPEGRVYFTYAAEEGIDATTNAAGFHATAQGNIDNDLEDQMWHYRKGDITAKTHSAAGAGTCASNEGIGATVEPCNASAPGSGASRF
jgi:hypothetical protein